MKSRVLATLLAAFVGSSLSACSSSGSGSSTGSGTGANSSSGGPASSGSSSAAAASSAGPSSGASSGAASSGAATSTSAASSASGGAATSGVSSSGTTNAGNTTGAATSTVSGSSGGSTAASSNSGTTTGSGSGSTGASTTGSGTTSGGGFDCRVDAGLCPTAAAPLCDPLTGACSPGCLSNADCYNAGNDLTCDLALPASGSTVAAAGSCVNCVTSDQCPQFGGQTCQANSCGQGCSSAADCSFSEPGCANQNCNSCVQATDCPANQACNGNGYCTCSGDGQCGGNAPRCLTSAGHPGAMQCGCATNSDCPPGTACNPNQANAGICLPTCVDGGTNCATISAGQGYVCNPSTGLCGACNLGFGNALCADNLQGTTCSGVTCGCTTAADCLDGRVCDPGSATCIPSCVGGGTQCAARTYCDPDSGLCGPCTANGQCSADPAGTACLTSANPAVCGCNSSSDCAAGQGCDPAAQRCVASCIDGGAICSGTCNQTTAACTACTGDAQCNPDGGSGGLFCLAGGNCGCVDGGSGSGCPTNDLCNLATQQCANDCVANPAGCSGSTRACNTTSHLCVNCLADQDCTNIIADGGVGSTVCDLATNTCDCTAHGAADCPSALICFNNLTCEAPVADGGLCFTAADCATGHCIPSHNASTSIGILAQPCTLDPNLNNCGGFQFCYCLPTQPFYSGCMTDSDCAQGICKTLGSGAYQVCSP